jgi:hypothetical protein
VEEAVQPGDCPLDDPAEAAQAGAVPSSSFGDHRLDAALPYEPAALVVAVAAGR